MGKVGERGMVIGGCGAHCDGSDDGCHDKVNYGAAALRGVDSIKVEADVDGEHQPNVNEENSTKKVALKLLETEIGLACWCE